MIYKYSPSTRGFYCEAIHTEIPVDAVEVSFAEYTSLFEGQTNGFEIVPDAVTGKPILVPGNAQSGPA